MPVYFGVLAVLCIIFVGDACFRERHHIYLQTRKPMPITAFFIVTILALVAGLRYGVGSDFHYYYSAYSSYATMELNLLDEPGIKVIARLAMHVHDDPATFIFLAACITVCLMVITLLRNSDAYWLSVLLYIFLCDWSGCFNGIRQYLAVAILFAGHSFIREKKGWKWLLVVMLAMLFHISAVLGLLFYFYPRIRLSVKNVIISAIAAYFGLRLYDRIFALIGFLKQDELILEGAAATYILNDINPLRIAVAWAPVLFFLIFIKHYDVEQEQFRFYVNMSVLNACIMTAAMNSAYLGRAGNYTSIYVALVWPLLLKPVKRENRIFIITGMLLCYVVYWYVEMSKPDLAVFRWVFQR